MIRLLRSAVFVLASGVVLLCAGSTTAADDGSTNACTTRDGKPSCTILRPPSPPVRIPPPGAPECIVAVGGLGSKNDDKTFNDLFVSLGNDPRYEIHRFGNDPHHPAKYDTYGSIDASGLALRDFVRSLSPECHLIHIVAHSMGGDVADRAFSLGLSSADGVATYLPIATPHNGALLADILTAANDVSDEGNEALRDISAALRGIGIPFAHDLTSDAVRELADRGIPRPPRGVLELRQRLANDEIALLPDNWDWRFESRDRLPDLGLSTIQEIEGHGGSLVNDAIRNTTEFVIRNIALPPDDRDAKHKILAFALSVGMMVLMVWAAAKLANALFLGVLLGTFVTTPLRAVLPGWETWWTRAFPNLLKKTAVSLGEADLLRNGEKASLPYVKGVVTRLRHEVDRLANDGVDADDDRPPIHEIDPRVEFVRAVLDRAANALKQL